LVPKGLSDYFIELVRKSMEDREKNNVKRKDFLQLLIELKNKGWLDDPDFKGALTPDCKHEYMLRSTKYNFVIITEINTYVCFYHQKNISENQIPIIPRSLVKSTISKRILLTRYFHLPVSPKIGTTSGSKKIKIDFHCSRNA